MKKILTIAAIAAMLVGCNNQPSETELRAQRARNMAADASSQISDPKEAEAIVNRAKLVNTPGVMFYVLVLGDMNTPLAYLTTGRVVSSGKRITEPNYLRCVGANCSWEPTPNLDSTFGSSGDYYYFWTTSGVYW